MSPDAAEHLGRQLEHTGFRPLPDTDDEGRLIGVRLWRLRAGHVEFLALRSHGVALAVRVVAEFNYTRPFDHGPVVDGRLGEAENALDWLLATSNPQSGQLYRPYLTPQASVPIDHIDEDRESHDDHRYPWS